MLRGVIVGARPGVPRARPGVTARPGVLVGDAPPAQRGQPDSQRISSLSGTVLKSPITTCGLSLSCAVDDLVDEQHLVLALAPLVLAVGQVRRVDPEPARSRRRCAPTGRCAPPSPCCAAAARNSCAPIGKRDTIASPSCPPPHAVDGAKTWCQPRAARQHRRLVRHPARHLAHLLQPDRRRARAPQTLSRDERQRAPPRGRSRPTGSASGTAGQRCTWRPVRLVAPPRSAAPVGALAVVGLPDRHRRQLRDLRRAAPARRRSRCSRRSSSRARARRSGCGGRSARAARPRRRR